MALLGFTVYKEKILDGSKRQTIRKLRKHPILVGDKLYLYWKLRTKDCEKLGEAVCKETFTILFKMYGLTIIKCGYGLGQFMNGEDACDLTRRDGFESLQEMFDWLKTNHHDFETKIFQVIRW